MSPLAPLAAVGSAVGSAVGGALLLGSQSTGLPSFLSFLAGDKTSPVKPTEEGESFDLQKNLGPLTDKLRQHLKHAGVGSGDPITFSLGPSGSIEVGTENPQWRSIEELVNGTPELANELSQLLAAAEQTTDSLAPQGELVLRAKDAELLVDKSPVAFSAAK